MMPAAPFAEIEELRLRYSQLAWHASSLARTLQMVLDMADVKNTRHAVHPVARKAIEDFKRFGGKL